MSNHKNPFLEPYNTPHDTVPFDRIRLEDFEEAFMEGIRRDNEQIEKTINNPEKPTFDNTIINTEEDEGYYDLRLSIRKRMRAITTCCQEYRQYSSTCSVQKPTMRWTHWHRRCSLY